MVTERLILRRFFPEDWRDMYEYLSDSEVVRYEPYEVFSEKDCKKEARVRSRSGDFWAVCLKSDDKLIGNMYMAKGDFDTWELGYVFNRAYHGHGYATEAARALISYVFAAKQAHRVIAHCTPLNERSWRLMERLGMRRESHNLKNVWFKRDGDGNPIWLDSYEYAILSHEWPTP
ncbi:GNAT family N-acetyltransferase [Ruminococcaceae bacterium OttesenSCG-928-L11]|nr:GNAT family N-acetyltransferase [Ruminococcaceae bacterium OttesenSCG-928-L11]